MMLNVLMLLLAEGRVFDSKSLKYEQGKLLVLVIRNLLQRPRIQRRPLGTTTQDQELARGVLLENIVFFLPTLSTKPNLSSAYLGDSGLLEGLGAEVALFCSCLPTG